MPEPIYVEIRVTQSNTTLSYTRLRYPVTSPTGAPETSGANPCSNGAPADVSQHAKVKSHNAGSKGEVHNRQVLAGGRSSFTGSIQLHQWRQMLKRPSWPLMKSLKVQFPHSPNLQGSLTRGGTQYRCVDDSRSVHGLNVSARQFLTPGGDGYLSGLNIAIENGAIDQTNEICVSFRGAQPTVVGRPREGSGCESFVCCVEAASSDSSGRLVCSRFCDLGLLVQSPKGEQWIPTTMDTGAKVNLMTRKLASLLGFPIDVATKGYSLNGIGENNVVKSLGTVRVPFKQPCKPELLRNAVFHVVEDEHLTMHHALLGDQLTEALGHLVRSGCTDCY